MSDAVIILCTAASGEEADRIADALVADRLAACVQTWRVASRYRWQGKVEQAAEVRLEIKTRAHLAGAVEARIRALHSYAVPEVVVLPIAGGAADYLAWIEDCVGGGT